MASNNYLLGHSGAPAPEARVGRPRNKVLYPTWRYHKDFPPRVFKTKEEVEKAEAEGWVDSPAKVNLAPPAKPPEEEKSIEIAAEEPQLKIPVTEPAPETVPWEEAKEEIKVAAPVEEEPQPEVIPAMPVGQPEPEKPDGRALLVTCPECGKEYRRSYMNLHMANAHKKKG